MSPSTTATWFLKTPRDDDTPVPAQPVPAPASPFGAECSLTPNLTRPWRNVRPFALVLSLVPGEQRPTPLATASCQAVAEPPGPPQPPSLQADPPRPPSPCPSPCPALDTLQPLSVCLAVRGPTLSPGPAGRPHRCPGQGDGRCPGPAGHTVSDTSRDAAGLLGHLGTLGAHAQPLPPSPPGPCPAGQFPAPCPQPAAAGGWCDPGAGPGTQPWGPPPHRPRPLGPACPEPPAEPPAPGTATLPPARCHLQTDRGCTRSPRPHHP